MATAVQLRLPGLSLELFNCYIQHGVTEIRDNYHSLPMSWNISLTDFVNEWCDSGCAKDVSDRLRPMYFDLLPSAYDHSKRPTRNEPSRDPCSKVWYVPKGTGAYPQRLEQAKVKHL